MAPSSSSSSSSNTCAICNDPLLIPSGADEGPSNVPDDVLLPRCSHHYHWSCVLDHYVEAAQERGEEPSACPTCGMGVLNERGEFLVSVRNEGGVTDDFDLLPEVRADLQIQSFSPHQNRILYFFSLLTDGDYVEAEEVLKGEDSDEFEGQPLDPNARLEEGGLTGLHTCAYNDDVEGINLLLRYGADRNLTGGEHNVTPLHGALMNGCEHAAAALST